MSRRPAVLALALGAFALLPGCAGMTRGVAAKQTPPTPGVSLTATEAIEQHNLNADKVQALEARPRITIHAPGLNGSTDGRMALERPKNFKLTISGGMGGGTVGDIGSNDQEFWFWAQSKKDNNVYHCSYDDLDRSALSAAFQPDWIVEAMGLRPISREEARQMTSKASDTPGAIKLVSTRRGTNGETLTKETVLDTAGRIKEHHLYRGQGKNRTQLASAVISEFQQVGVDGEKPVTLPSVFTLTWFPEELKLDIQLGHAKLLPSYPEDRRAALFTEPDGRGKGRVNLAELAPRQAPASAREADPATPRVRSSRPAPSSRDSDVRLGSPEPFGVDDSARNVRDPVALTADLSGDEKADPSAIRTVRPALPRAVDQ